MSRSNPHDPKDRMDDGRNLEGELVDIGRNVRAMREIRSWTQSELARKAGLSRTTVRRIEEGKPCWRPTLERLAVVFNIPLHEFLVTNRFSNVLDSSREYVVHFSRQYFWHTRGDRRNSIPSDNEDLIQDPAERRRLGKLGFVAAFVSMPEFYLPIGPGVLRIELYGRHEQRFMPQYSVVAMCVLNGTVVVTIGKSSEELGPGDAVAFDTATMVAIEPRDRYEGGTPCEVLIAGSHRRKV